MERLESALSIMRQSGLTLCGGCRFGFDLLLPNVRSASRLPKEPKTILIALFPYYTGRRAKNLSLYCAIPDYHIVAGEMLSRAAERLKAAFGGEYAAFVDASPIDEVTAAVRAGLGVRGKNGQLIAGEYGSMVFIGEIVTDLELSAADSPERGCEGCGLCIAACPTGALGGDGFEKSRCRSHFSQKKGELSQWEAHQLKEGGLAWGCDLCTLACPHNAKAAATPIEEFFSDFEPELTEQNLPLLLKNRAFSWRGEKVLRRNLGLLDTKPDRTAKRRQGSV